MPWDEHPCNFFCVSCSSRWSTHASKSNMVSEHGFGAGLRPLGCFSFSPLGAAHPTAVSFRVRLWISIVCSAVVPLGTERAHYFGTGGRGGSNAMASAFLETAKKRQCAKVQLARSALRRTTRESMAMAAPTSARDL